MIAGLTWDRQPAWSDPRVPFAALLTVYITLGITVLGFNRTVPQILLTVGSACALDMVLHYLLRGRRLLFPLSAMISGLGLSILMNYAHSLWLPLVPVVLAIGSKYVITCQGRHAFNPTLFALVVCIKSSVLFSAAPAYQFGGSLAMAAFVVTAALVLFVFRIQRIALIVSFLGFYGLQLALRGYLTRHHVPPETLFLGALTSASFYLFTFFMITDPQTSPATRRGQIGMSFFIVVVDLVLHRFQTLSTLFLAGFAYFTLRFLWLHWQAWQPGGLAGRFTSWVPRAALVTGIATIAWAVSPLARVSARIDPGFFFQEIPVTQSGLDAGRSDILERLDPRIQHVGKWILSAGDAVAVADFDGDSQPDVFLTYPWKDPAHRGALYRNVGGWRFERIPLPALDAMAQNPETAGLASGALWFDYDNDGDADLLVMVGYGYSVLLENRWAEERAFRDVTRAVGLHRYSISLTANAWDFNRDGRTDLILCDAFATELPGYSPPVRFNPFQLPKPEYPGDRRMFNFMHRSWHNADNGGGCHFFQNTGGGFVERDIGLEGRRWSLAVGTGDFNRDGWTDLYIANDFGPDQLYLNEEGRRLRPVRGKLSGSLGRDTYKGMNSSIGDVDNNGYPDVYVSNVHERLQAEGSLLWMNDGRLGTDGASAMHDEAMARNALNEQRFGWGAAMGDLDRDGRLDIIQTNGHVDNTYDPLYAGCPDYWYWNDKIALTNPDNHGHADRWADLRGRCIFPAEKNRVYLNRGQTFVDVSEAARFDRPGVYRAVALADFESRGRLDAVVTSMVQPAALFRLEGKGGHWVGFDLHGDGVRCNADALGTQVEIRTAAGTQRREVQASNGFSAQGDHRLLLGLGEHTGAVRVRIEWCGGVVIEEKTFEPDRYHTLRLRANQR